MQGVIISRRHCYGFIEIENKSGENLNYFFHETDMARGQSFLGLKIGDMVDFEEEKSDRGLKAKQVRKITN